MSKEKITERSTKATIWEAYQESLKKSEQKEKAIHNPEKIAEVQVNTATVKKAEAIKTSTLDNIVEKIQKDIEKANDEVNKYQEIKEAIKIKNNELKELFEIETNAFSLTALINAQEEARQEFLAEMKAKKEELKDLEDETKAKVKETEKETQKYISTMTEEAKANTKRAEAEWKYDFDRAKMIEKNKLTDQLEGMKKDYQKAYEEREAIINARLSAVEAKEENIETLQNEVKNLEAALITVKEETTKDVTDKLKISNGFETRYIKKEFQAENDLLKMKIENLEIALNKEQLNNITLSERITEAYNKLESLAKTTVEGNSNQKMINSLENALKTNNGSSK